MVNSTCVISAFRVYAMSTLDFMDIQYTTPKADMFSCIEPCLAVVLASIPLMRPWLDVISSKPRRSAERRGHIDYHVIGEAASSNGGIDWLAGYRKHSKTQGRQNVQPTLAQSSENEEEEELPPRRECSRRITADMQP